MGGQNLVIFVRSRCEEARIEKLKDLSHQQSKTRSWMSRKCKKARVCVMCLRFEFILYKKESLYLKFVR